jgi:hypothetical protein
MFFCHNYYQRCMHRILFKLAAVNSIIVVYLCTSLQDKKNQMTTIQYAEFTGFFSGKESVHDQHLSCINQSEWIFNKEP